MRMDRDDHRDRGRREDNDEIHHNNDHGISHPQPDFEHRIDRGFPDVVDTLQPPPRPAKGDRDGSNNN